MEFASYVRAHQKEIRENAKGDDFAERGNFEKANECYDNALQIDPKNAYAMYGKGVIYYKCKKYDKAYACFNEVLKNKQDEQGPFFEKVLLLKGKTSSKIGMYEESIKCFKEVLKRNPKNVKVLYELQEVLFYLKRYEECTDIFENFRKN